MNCKLLTLADSWQRNCHPPYSHLLALSQPRTARLPPSLREKISAEFLWDARPQPAWSFQGILAANALHPPIFPAPETGAWRRPHAAFNAFEECVKLDAPGALCRAGLAWHRLVPLPLLGAPRGDPFPPQRTESSGWPLPRSNVACRGSHVRNFLSFFPPPVPIPPKLTFFPDCSGSVNVQVSKCQCFKGFSRRTLRNAFALHALTLARGKLQCLQQVMGSQACFEHASRQV